MLQQQKTVFYHVPNGAYMYNQMRLVYVGKSSLAQTGSAVNKDSHKDVEVYW